MLIDLDYMRELQSYKKERLSVWQRWCVRGMTPVFVLLPDSKPIVKTVGWTDWGIGNYPNHYQVFFTELDAVYSVDKSEVVIAEVRDLRWARNK
jgi:hypothetical protein